ncbi:hypothetical protein AB1Y20_007298 [Prymnesium parvum]|uniref:FkbM family methyltransferase n=1 Tax=Prymnesium parvum TaxID=97485 RepID=A0AB34IWT7_PRYPA
MNRPSTMDYELVVQHLNLARAHARLLPVRQWIALLPNSSLVVQVGANDHAYAGVSGAHDPAVECIRRGWRALLIEPTPLAFERLSARYEHHRRQGVKLLNAAICNSSGRGSAPFGGPSCRPGQTARMYNLDTTNATGHWGDNRSDARCITMVPRSNFHYLLELASFDPWHVGKHSKQVLKRIASPVLA